MHSSDDLHWLCSWGGQPLLPWEDFALFSNDPAVVLMVDYWMWKESFHVHFSDTVWQMTLENSNIFSHQAVDEIRMRSDFRRLVGLPHSSPP